MSKRSTKVMEKVSPVTKKREYTGLCLTCQNASTCIYPRNLDQPVLQCEEFDCYETPMERTTVDKILAIARTQAESRPEKMNSLKGLCINCENRATCIFPKPETGVWRCEEYI
ncbi:MAG: hypothetical protein A2W07_09500 [candidate division Zixibacteria bacterium RBG_16_43_9]|nr:MAG: hypothetical protein A2W07_09500 [candidate division Zixibacteria bacterium RBG_16_43_9]